MAGELRLYVNPDGPKQKRAATVDASEAVTQAVTLDCAATFRLNL